MSASRFQDLESVDGESEGSSSSHGHEMTPTRNHIHRFGKRRGYTEAIDEESQQPDDHITPEQQAITIFMDRQIRASSCWRQTLTISTVIIIVQVENPE